MIINKPLRLMICDVEKNEQENIYTMRISPCFIQTFQKILIRGTPDDILVYFDYTKKPPKIPTKRQLILRWALDHSKILRNWHAKRLVKKLGIPVKKGEGCY